MISDAREEASMAELLDSIREETQPEKDNQLRTKQSSRGTHYIGNHLPDPKQNLLAYFNRLSTDIHEQLHDGDNVVTAHGAEYINLTNLVKKIILD